MTLGSVGEVGSRTLGESHAVLGVRGAHRHRCSSTRYRFCWLSAEGHGTTTASDWIADVQGTELV